MFPKNELLDIFEGIFSLMGLHILAIIAIIILFRIRLYTKFLGHVLFNNSGYDVGDFLQHAAVYFSLTQLIYVIPGILRLKQQQRWGLMKGVIIGAVLTVLLNGSCWFLAD